MLECDMGEIDPALKTKVGEDGMYEEDLDPNLKGYYDLNLDDSGYQDYGISLNSPR